MRVDFHFYAIYALARAAGLAPDDAYVIAYSSQYTDDEANPNKMDFENGGSFEPRITAHSLYSLSTISDRICKQVWAPFHFIPGNEGGGKDRLITRPNGEVIEKIIEEFLKNYSSLKYSPHLLGIILHVYADTWSHQNFMGFRNKMNEVDEVKIEGEPNDFIEKLVAELGGEYLIPNIGHAQTASIPDEPNRRWSYIDYNGKALQIINLDRTVLAAQSCYNLLLKFLEKFPNLKDKPSLTWPQISASISGLFGTPGDLDNCINAWKSAISNGEIGCMPEGRDIDINYNDHEWFDEAIVWETPEKTQGEGSSHEDQYLKKNNFDISNFNLFNDAAGAYYASLFIKTAEGLGLEEVMI